VNGLTDVAPVSRSRDHERPRVNVNLSGSYCPGTHGMRIVALSNSPLVVGYAVWVTFVILWNVTERRSSRTIATAGAALWVGPGCRFDSDCARTGEYGQPPAVEKSRSARVGDDVRHCRRRRVVLLGEVSSWTRLVSQRFAKEGHRIGDTGPYRDENGKPRTQWIKTPWFASLWGNPRFQDLVRRLNVPPRS
jgi:hypothetical protein